jgi:hypothetical protein
VQSHRHRAENFVSNQNAFSHRVYRLFPLVLGELARRTHEVALEITRQKSLVWMTFLGFARHAAIDPLRIWNLKRAGQGSYGNPMSVGKCLVTLTIARSQSLANAAALVIAA